MKHSLFITCLLLTGHLSAQKPNWVVTPAFEEGIKTGIVAVRDTLLIVSLTNGVMRSFDSAVVWTKTLKASATFTVFATNQGTVVAGGLGEVYFSNNYGATWDSVKLTHNYPMTQFVADTEGGLYGISWDVVNDRFEGAGVFYSANQGKTWIARNNGLNNQALTASRITIDRNNRLYLTLNDQQPEAQRGLYLSDDKGISWRYVPIKINGGGAIQNDIRPDFTRGLSIGRDSLFYSFHGVAGQVYVQLNLAKNLTDVDNSSLFWHPVGYLPLPNMWWTDRPLNDRHFARNGDVYSSVFGRENIGGGLYKERITNKWIRTTNLRPDFGYFHPQHFAEFSTGRVFMIQDYDEFIYKTRASAVADVTYPVAEPDVLIYPNPVSGGRLFCQFGAATEGILALYDESGRMLLTQKFSGDAPDMRVQHLPNGIYWLLIDTRLGKKWEKMVFTQ